MIKMITVAAPNGGRRMEVKMINVNEIEISEKPVIITNNRVVAPSLFKWKSRQMSKQPKKTLTNNMGNER